MPSVIAENVRRLEKRGLLKVDQDKLLNDILKDLIRKHFGSATTSTQIDHVVERVLSDQKFEGIPYGLFTKTEIRELQKTLGPEVEALIPGDPRGMRIRAYKGIYAIGIK